MAHIYLSTALKNITRRAFKTVDGPTSSIDYSRVLSVCKQLSLGPRTQCRPSHHRLLSVLSAILPTSPCLVLLGRQNNLSCPTYYHFPRLTMIATCRHAGTLNSCWYMKANNSIDFDYHENYTYINHYSSYCFVTTRLSIQFSSCFHKDHRW